MGKSAIRVVTGLDRMLASDLLDVYKLRLEGLLCDHCSSLAQLSVLREVTKLETSKSKILSEKLTDIDRKLEVIKRIDNYNKLNEEWPTFLGLSDDCKTMQDLNDRRNIFSQLNKRIGDMTLTNAELKNEVELREKKLNLLNKSLSVATEGLEKASEELEVYKEGHKRFFSEYMKTMRDLARNEGAKLGPVYIRTTRTMIPNLRCPTGFSFVEDDWSKILSDFHEISANQRECEEKTNLMLLQLKSKEKDLDDLRKANKLLEERGLESEKEIGLLMSHLLRSEEKIDTLVRNLKSERDLSELKQEDFRKKEKMMLMNASSISKENLMELQEANNMLANQEYIIGSLRTDLKDAFAEVERLRAELEGKLKKKSDPDYISRSLLLKKLKRISFNKGLMSLTGLIVLIQKVPKAEGMCNKESSGLAVSSFVCTEDNVCETVWSGEALLSSGEDKCFKLGNSTYRITVGAAKIPLIKKTHTDCIPFAIDRPITDNCFYRPSDKWGTLAKDVGLHTTTRCGDEEVASCGGFPVSEGHVEICRNFTEGKELFEIATKVKNCHLDGCPLNHKSFVAIYCLDPTLEFEVYKPLYTNPTATTKYFIDGIEVKESENFSSKIMVQLQNPFEIGAILRRKSTDTWYYREDMITPGDCHDICAVTIEEDRTKIMAQKCYSSSGTCRGSSLTSVKVDWFNYMRKDWGKLLPYLDPNYGLTLTKDGVIGITENLVVLSFIIKSKEKYEGIYTSCDLDSIRLRVKENDCPKPDILTIQGCIPVVKEGNCPLIYLGSNGLTANYSVSLGPSNCYMLVANSGKSKNLSFIRREKTCVVNPNEAYDPDSKDTGSKTGGWSLDLRLPWLKWLGLGSGMGFVLLGLMAYLVYKFVFKRRNRASTPAYSTNVLRY